MVREYLVTLRKEKGLTQKQISEKLDISESYYNQIENGERQKNMDVSLVSKLSSILGISIPQIIKYEELQGE